MKRIRSWAFSILAILFVAFATAAAAIPGPQRMVMPGLFDFVEIAPNIYAPKYMKSSRKHAVLSDLKSAAETVSRFYQKPLRMPWVFLCPGTSCDGPFGKNVARGVAYGAHIVRLDELGLNEMIATHEFSHIALKRRAGQWPSLSGEIPAWFDEGLATFLSRDDRYENSYPATVRTDLQSAGPWWNWGDIIARNSWQAAYGESRNMVRELFREVGQRGLLEILDRVAKGEEFDAAVEAVREG